jgi:3-hydroxy-9,10-secoandrosta-1,3,5(10)-triene-9,17-dione monooxygenase reductase component
LKTVDPAHFRTVMGRFATGVTVVTASGPEGPTGMTANAITSLSLEPLLLLVCFDREARTLGAVRSTGAFGVNVLSAGQAELAASFASKRAEAEKFEGVDHDLHQGIPVLRGAHAWIGCRLETLVEGGDHVIGIGAVTAAETGEGEPLLWYAGRYGVFSNT